VAGGGHGSVTSVESTIGNQTSSATSSATAAGRLDSNIDVPQEPALPEQPSVDADLTSSATADVEQQGVAASRQAHRGVSDAKYGAGDASFTATAGVTGAAGRMEGAEFRQRDAVAARSQELDDAQAQARRTVDDPSSVATERAELEASQRADQSLPVRPSSVQAQAGAAAGVVADPQAAAQARAEDAVSTQQAEVEVKVGVSGSAGASREEIVGSPTTRDDEKK
jgi:hypothetical protein